jgi:hypothetical protein
MQMRLDALEEFWDSEQPRLGEAEALGWAAWIGSGKQDRRPQAVTNDHSPRTMHTTDPYSNWSTMELHEDQVCYLPARSSDEIDSADPYSSILFSDIRPFLQDISTPRAKKFFQFAWVSFLQLPLGSFESDIRVASEDDCWDDSWRFTFLIRPRYLQYFFPEQYNQTRSLADSISGIAVGKEREYSSCFVPGMSFAYPVLQPLEMVTEPSNSMWSPADVEGIHTALLRNVFAHLRSRTGPDPQWDNMALACEVAAENLKRYISYLN